MEDVHNVSNDDFRAQDQSRGMVPPKVGVWQKLRFLQRFRHTPTFEDLGRRLAPKVGVCKKCVFLQQLCHTPTFWGTVPRLWTNRQSQHELVVLSPYKPTLSHLSGVARGCASEDIPSFLGEVTLATLEGDKIAALAAQ